MVLAHRLQHVLSRGSRSQLTHTQSKTITLCTMRQFVLSPHQHNRRARQKFNHQDKPYYGVLNFLYRLAAKQMVITMLCCIYNVNFKRTRSFNVLSVFCGSVNTGLEEGEAEEEGEEAITTIWAIVCVIVDRRGPDRMLAGGEKKASAISGKCEDIWSIAAERQLSSTSTHLASLGFISIFGVSKLCLPHFSFCPQGVPGFHCRTHFAEAATDLAFKRLSWMSF